MSSAIVRLVTALRRSGWKGVSKRIAYYGCTHGWLLGLADVQILGLVAFNPLTGQELMGDYLFLLASPLDLDAILLCSPLADRRKLSELFTNFFARGFRCAIVRHQDAVIGYNWAFTGGYTITLDDYRHHTARVAFPVHAVFTGNAYVRPEHRGRGLIRRLKRFLFSHYPSGTRFYTAVSELNNSSLRANGRVGFEKLATLRFTRTPFGNRLYLRRGDGDRWAYIGGTSSTLQIDGRDVLARR